MNAISPMVADPIRTFMPGVDDEEHLLRCRLVKAHNIASSRFPADWKCSGSRVVRLDPGSLQRLEVRSCI
jgi:hypothetical protein